MLINATYVLSQGVHMGSSIDIELLYIELDSVYYYVYKFVHSLFSKFSMLNSYFLVDYYLEKKHIFNICFLNIYK